MKHRFFILLTPLLIGPVFAVAEDQTATSPILGILQQTPEHLKQNREAGAEMLVVELGWNRAEPKPDSFDADYFQEIRERMVQYRKHGFLLVLDFGFQYPPDWIFDLPHSRYVNQYGESFRSEETGVEIPNAVFNQAVRDQQKQYAERVFQELGTDFHLIRLGWTKYGEIAYPTHTFQGKENCYWGFDEVATGKAPGRPPGVPPSPAGDWKPGESSPEHRNAEKFINWYLNALLDYQNWQIQTVRSCTQTPLAVLYPSWGLRPGDAAKAVEKDLNGSTPRESTGELQRGLDFQRLVSGIRDDNVIVYCTWLDSNPEYSQDDASDPAGWSPARYLAELAATHRLRLQIWGENTGGGGPEILQRCADRIRKYGYRGFLWAFERDLYDGKPPEIGDFKAFSEGLQQP